MCLYPPTQHSNKPHKTSDIWKYMNPILNGLTNPTNKIIFILIIKPSSRYYTLSFLIISFFELFTFPEPAIESP
jgi:hypothetical protein